MLIRPLRSRCMHNLTITANCHLTGSISVASTKNYQNGCACEIEESPLIPSVESYM